MRCRNCGSDVRSGLSVCPQCGATLKRRKFLRRQVRCRSCQAQVSFGLTICPYCGAPLRSSWRRYVLLLVTLALLAAVAYMLVNYVPWPKLRTIVGRVRVPSVAFLATPTFTTMPSPTRAATRTKTPSPTWTKTLVPATETPTVTPVRPTATRRPGATRTPTPRFVAPRLAAPADQAQFQGSGARIVLSWEPMGTLAEDEWYALSVRFTADGVARYSGTWTKDTSWVVASDLYGKAGQAERAFQWDVTVMKQTGLRPDGGQEGVALSPKSETRTFLWS